MGDVILKSSYLGRFLRQNEAPQEERLSDDGRQFRVRKDRPRSLQSTEQENRRCNARTAFKAVETSQLFTGVSLVGVRGLPRHPDDPASLFF